jgi:hypothetical protein
MHTSAKALTSVEAEPVESTHGCEGVSAEMRMSLPTEVRKAVRKERKLVRSSEEYCTKTNR